MQPIVALALIVLFPSAVSALDCRTVETDSKIEMVCEGESPAVKNKGVFISKKPGKNETENLEIMDQLQEELSDLIRNNPGPESIKELLANARIISSAIRNQCAEDRLYSNDAYVKCLHFMKEIYQGQAEIMVKSADFFVKNNMKSLAKEIYQDVIKIFQEEAYASFVRQAESGLENLNEK